MRDIDRRSSVSVDATSCGTTARVDPNVGLEVRVWVGLRVLLFMVVPVMGGGAVEICKLLDSGLIGLVVLSRVKDDRAV